MAAISIVIGSILLLQTLSAFSLTPGPIERAPWLWPFLDYPMYSWPKYEGDAVDDLHIIGVTTEGDEIEILPEDLGLSFWMFKLTFRKALLEERPDDVRAFLDEYEARYGVDLVGVKVVSDPMVLSDGALVPAERRLILEMMFTAAGIGGR